jgi:hypothetical protein
MRRSIKIRRVLEVADPLLSDGYLTLALHRPIIIELEKNPDDFRVVCYTPQHGAEQDSDGSQELSLWLRAFSHYEPLRRDGPDDNHDVDA